MDKRLKKLKGLKLVMDGFKRDWGIPQCAGAIDWTHVPISAPVMNYTDYYNRKGTYSVILQPVVDYKYLFTVDGQEVCMMNMFFHIHQFMIEVEMVCYFQML